MEFDPDLFAPNDKLHPDEFGARYEALLALIEEAESNDDQNKQGIFEEALTELEVDNPNAYNALVRNELQGLDKVERRERLKVAQSHIDLQGESDSSSVKLLRFSVTAKNDILD